MLDAGYEDEIRSVIDGVIKSGHRMRESFDGLSGQDELV